ncbi:Hypothetical predicted protein [Paramuricea clavata]|uniref:Uncharacterized protein n=1 Tax=Paramuricea clavata TaxID=317549 RepID=A0A6S7J3H8_PARCT|nr:Hypothetical predicted protein [Paramuricea clavata]
MVYAIRKSTECTRYKRQEKKRALLLYYIGESTLNIFETLPETGTKDDYDKAYQALNDYFKPHKNTWSIMMRSSSSLLSSLSQPIKLLTRQDFAALVVGWRNSESDLDTDVDVDVDVDCSGLRRESGTSPALAFTLGEEHSNILTFRRLMSVPAPGIHFTPEIAILKHRGSLFITTNSFSSFSYNNPNVSSLVLGIYRLIAWVKSLYVLSEVMKKTRRVSPY